jgi:tetratricopeptide (TPR) repeat protein
MLLGPSSPPPSGGPKLPRRLCYTEPKRAFVFVLLSLICGCVALARAQSDSDVRAFEQGVRKLQSAGDPLDLQRFVLSAPFGSLKDDGLQWLIWEFRTSRDGRAHQWSQELLKTQPDNALALAVVADAEHRIDLALRSLHSLDQLRPARGMQVSEFDMRKADLERDLNAQVGYAYYQRQDFVNARGYLRRAISTSSTNPQYTYALAVADLYGANPDEAEGFQMLARTVNLAKGTPQGDQLANFALQKFTSRGGSTSNWNHYLQNTVTGVVLARIKPATTPQTPGLTTPEPARTAAVTASARPAVTSSSPRPPIGNTAPAAAEMSVPTAGDEPSNIPSPDFPVHTQRPFTPSGAPFSIGILVETSKASRDSRRAVVNALSDMVRHLRPNDEAFVVSFSRQVVFEQDLTSDPKALQSAFDNIKPDRGTALLDAVAFAAGHLSRVAKNQKKILLVVSDGENQNEQVSPLQVSGELSASQVKIFCIGMGVESRDDQYRLQALARETGGEAQFIEASNEFRQAAQHIAANLGVAFP